VSKDPSTTTTTLQKHIRTPLSEMGGTGSKRNGGRKAAPTGVDVQKHHKHRDRILVNKPNVGKVTKRMGSGLTSARNPHHKTTKGVRFMRSTRLMPKYGHQLSPGSAYLSCKSLPCRAVCLTLPFG
jgi:hypothetical protein